MADRKLIKKHNAIKYMYERKYELDKQFEFTWPKRKDDFEAYLNILLNVLDEAFNIAEQPRIKGHEGLVYRPENKKKKTEEDE